VRASINKTTSSLLFAVNTPPREFDELPHGWDASASFHALGSRLGALRGFVLERRDGVGVQLERDSFDGFLHAASRHRLVIVDWRRPLSRGWTASVAAGHDRYIGRTDAGVLALDITDAEDSARLDVTGVAAAGLRIRVGADVGHSSAHLIGTVPTRGGDFGGTSGDSRFVVAHQDVRAGGYVEASQIALAGRVTPTVGLRIDRYAQSGAWEAHPRLNVSIAAGPASNIRLAWGRYSQAPSPRYFDEARGRSALQPLVATHAIVGFEQGRLSDLWFLRVEAYHKSYRQLPVDDGTGRFASDGYGYARGVDLFVRRLIWLVDVRASASVLDARRRWTSPEQRERYPLPSGAWAPDFAIPVTWQLNATVPVWRTVSMSISMKHAAGRPFTPALGSIATPTGFEPVWGPINSERVPAYRRADLSVSHTRTIGQTTLIVFGAVDNVTGRRNFFEYAYSADFSSRRPVTSASPRSVYLGCSFVR
jgi:hypothetical protein